MTERLGYECVAHLRGAEEVRAIAETAPFDPEVAAGRKLHVALLEELPKDAAAERVLALAKWTSNQAKRWS